MFKDRISFNENEIRTYLSDDERDRIIKGLMGSDFQDKETIS